MVTFSLTEFRLWAQLIFSAVDSLPVTVCKRELNALAKVSNSEIGIHQLSARMGRICTRAWSCIVDGL